MGRCENAVAKGTSKMVHDDLLVVGKDSDDNSKVTSASNQGSPTWLNLDIQSQKNPNYFQDIRSILISRGITVKVVQTNDILGRMEKMLKKSKPLDEVTKSSNYLILKTNRDGDCLFSAISVMVYGNDDLQDVLRAKTADWLENTSEFDHMIDYSHLPRDCKVPPRSSSPVFCKQRDPEVHKGRLMKSMSIPFHWLVYTKDDFVKAIRKKKTYSSGIEIAVISKTLGIDINTLVIPFSNPTQYSNPHFLGGKSSLTYQSDTSPRINLGLALSDMNSNNAIAIINEEEHFKPIVNEHYLIKKQSKFNCPKCNQNFITKSIFDSHRKGIHEHICKYGRCNLSFNSGKESEMHYKAEHEDIKGRSTFTCKLCDGSFSKKEDFQDHMTLSHSILCTECELRFVSNLQRSFHRNATHNANARMGAKVANNYKSFSVPDPPKRHKGHRTYSEMQEKMNPVNRDPIKCTIKECTCH